MTPPIQPRVREANIYDHLAVLFTHRRLIAPMCGIAMVTTVAVCLLWPPSYVATASIVPPPELSRQMSGLGMGLFGGAEAALLRNVMDVSSIADLYAGILESRVVVDTIIDRFNLVDAYETNGSRYRAEKILRRKTGIRVSAEGIVCVAVEDRDPDRAAAMANAYVEELDRQNKRLSGGQATSKRQFLEHRLNEIEEKFRRIESIPSYEAQVQETLYELLIRECELAKIEEAKSMPTIQVLDPATRPERRKARGTGTKAILAGVVSFLFAAFIAFGREHSARRRLLEAEPSLPASDHDGPTGAGPGGRPVGPQRRLIQERETAGGCRRLETVESAPRG